MALIHVIKRSDFICILGKYQNFLLNIRWASFPWSTLDQNTPVRNDAKKLTFVKELQPVKNDL